MRNVLIRIRRLHPLLRGLAVLYLAGTLLLAAGHQHHNGLPGHDCALCTAASTPVALSPAVQLEMGPASKGILLTISADPVRDSESPRTTQSRAPPLV